MDYAKESLRLHGEWKGKIEVISKVKVDSKEDLSLAYTPGVAQPCIEINKDYNFDFANQASDVANPVTSEKPQVLEPVSTTETLQVSEPVVEPSKDTSNESSVWK